jgi:CO/xanthine dehydrogenase Mo-binding subunit
MGEFAIGQSVLRREDPRLLRGQGRFFDDLKLADQLHAAIVRSPHAHADITGIDTRAALQMPGVHAVLTGADYRGDGLGSLPSMAAYQRRGGGPMFLPPRPAIASDRVMHIGYPVAVVVADALDQARDAAECVVVEYEPRPCVVSAREAFAPDAPQLYDDCPNNEAYCYQAGDKAKVDTAFAVAAHVVEQRLIINRVTANPIEPRGVIGVYDAGTGRYTLYCGFQRPWGDTDAVAFGMGTGGSRSTTMSGGAIVAVSDKIIAKGKKLAAHLLEASEGDVEFKDGRFIITGTDSAMGIHEVAKAAFQLDKLPTGMEPGLYETATYRARSSNFPNGCHVCEVEIDPETGSTRVIGYWVVDDVGTVINPMLVKGQIMGGIAQGLGQVLMEDKSYDETGQVLTGSFMDYAMPRADNFCAVVIEDNPVPTPTNPLGVKGAGEAGTVGSLSAGVNAIVDALSVLGIKHIDMPCTPHRVWQAIANAGACVTTAHQHNACNRP